MSWNVYPITTGQRRRVLSSSHAVPHLPLHVLWNVLPKVINHRWSRVSFEPTTAHNILILDFGGGTSTSRGLLCKSKNSSAKTRRTCHLILALLPSPSVPSELLLAHSVSIRGTSRLLLPTLRNLPLEPVEKVLREFND